ncbi:MAG: hypothetical protein HZA54_06680, partial [Planctomycetes bacterium]|nr:hypothetical protein [Planctomycetota bacterium]
MFRHMRLSYEIGGASRSFVFSGCAPVLIGLSPECGLRLQAPGIAPRHVLCTPELVKLRVRAEPGATPIYVNDRA